MDDVEVIHGAGFSKIGIRECDPEEAGLVNLTSGGEPEGLPDCPNCSRKMMRLLSIEAIAARPILGFPDRNVDLIFCWRCAAALGFWYSGNLDSGITIWKLTAESNSGYPPYEEYPDFAPVRKMAFRLETADERRLHEQFLLGKPYRDVLAEAERLNVPIGKIDSPAYQVGGVPYLHEPPGANKCVRCGGVLWVLATVANHNETPEGWAGGDQVLMLFQQCRDCGAIYASHQTD